MLAAALLAPKAIVNEAHAVTMLDSDKAPYTTAAPALTWMRKSS
ncbi:hypothetical protein JCM19231_3791 [Vibrio ishigakensis]|uniref:Uncharacterized protein n=1 Tax=Vibrio ishigakensis TaxID=1481914 RepID=A0A0B8NU77_9VIBR|nr:hypothetical protein JCM19231_3791 [Vibrio ishigakensis]